MLKKIYPHIKTMDFPSLVLRLLVAAFFGCLLFTYKFWLSLYTTYYVIQTGGTLTVNLFIMIFGSLLIGFTWYLLLGSFWGWFIENFMSNSSSLITPSDDLSIVIKNYTLMVFASLPITIIYLYKHIFTIEEPRRLFFLIIDDNVRDVIIHYFYIYVFTLIPIAIIFSSQLTQKRK